MTTSQKSAQPESWVVTVVMLPVRVVYYLFYGLSAANKFQFANWLKDRSLAEFTLVNALFLATIHNPSPYDLLDVVKNLVLNIASKPEPIYVYTAAAAWVVASTMVLWYLLSKARHALGIIGMILTVGFFALIIISAAGFLATHFPWVENYFVPVAKWGWFFVGGLILGWGLKKAAFDFAVTRQGTIAGGEVDLDNTDGDGGGVNR